MNTSEQDIVIYGAGGHARVVADLMAVSSMKAPKAFFQDEASVSEINGARVRPYSQDILPGAGILIAIGNNAVRKKISEKVSDKHHFVMLIHPKAYLSPEAIVEEGTVILANATVQSGARIGRHVIINAGAVIDHDAVIEDFVHIAPNVYIGGGAIIKKGALISPGAVVMRHTHVESDKEVPPLSLIN